ncbi:MAG: ABC transporter ATP-binding protein [Proteobacteria bacterium]|nr:ABC transporter ATP-binding protein [Pseudomonadota bacterium]MBU1738876.1 ABC transporter ATP-binding protein [Pseudomonadota bacterium]
MIRTEEISKIYNAGKPDELHALRDISVEIERGQVTVLQGPSGSGKTSLLSLIGCMARPTSGRIIVDGKDVVKLPERFLTGIRREKFGFIFQQFHLVKDISVEENILLPLYPLEIGIGGMKDRAATVLGKLRIENRKHLKVKKLSGGEQQRVAIARALINAPEIIIADEPTAHLDRKLAGEFMDILASLQDEGKTIVIATHDPFVSENQLVRKVVCMEDGRVEKVVER